jgi:hypothetical protein
MAQTGSNHPSRHQFGHRDVQFSPRKITVGTLESKLNDVVTRFFISTIFELLAASNAMVADESGVRGVRRRGLRAKFRHFKH